MPRLRPTPQTLSFLTTGPSQQSTPTHICLACRTTRQPFHTTPTAHAQQSWLQRMQASIFGTPESKEAAAKREEARKKKIAEVAERGVEVGAAQVVRDRAGREY